MAASSPISLADCDGLRALSHVPAFVKSGVTHPGSRHLQYLVYPSAFLALSVARGGIRYTYLAAVGFVSSPSGSASQPLTAPGVHRC